VGSFSAAFFYRPIVPVAGLSHSIIGASSQDEEMEDHPPAAEVKTPKKRTNDPKEEKKPKKPKNKEEKAKADETAKEEEKAEGNEKDSSSSDSDSDSLGLPGATA
jgi:hypothetical protein